MTLYTYCIPFDDGTAPNPFWGVCTLVICKPKIRKTARVCDWIVGTGSSKSPIGDIHDRVVYAMRVTRKMTMKEYDAYTNKHSPEKVPHWSNADKRRRLGDSIYDFSSGEPKLSQSVHFEENKEYDLNGEFALLSREFFYFGNKPQQLPPELLPILNVDRNGRPKQGHRSKENDTYIEKFENWLYGLGYKSCTLVGEPQTDIFKAERTIEKCAKECAREDADER